MTSNTGKLAGRTIFISGASRGIGKAIALKCARDGANIVIAAKTTEPHPKLPGTIYTAAKEVEEAGGQCLPCVVDIRHEADVEKAVSDTVKKFGGIDILINNASAIHPVGTVVTPMKRYDLMMDVNTRGTFLCSKHCVPHLKNGTNPHILNISPPLSMKAKWFKDHVAYTMAKFGMSMCVLGMAEEFKEDKIAVNALWPRTAIWTAAMGMLGGEDVKSQCRTPEIMADAAYVMLNKDHTFTGNFSVDDEILKDAGVTDLTQYSYDPNATLLPDFFLEDENLDALKKAVEDQGSFSQKEGAAAGDAEITKSFTVIQGLLTPDLVKSVGGIYLFDLKESGKWHIDLKNDSGSAGLGEAPGGPANCTMTMGKAEFMKMMTGKLSSTTAFMTGKLKIKGDLGLAMKLEKLMQQVKTKL